MDEYLDGQFCNTGKNGACWAGSLKCTNGVPSCIQQGQPTTELCNGIDDDCDGTWDNGIPPTSCVVPGQVGPCSFGQTQCDKGLLSCQQKAFPKLETCNLLDDDCDGTVDEGC